MACPGCGADTPNVELRHHNGAYVETRFGPTWCGPCLIGKATTARAALDPCHCAQFPAPHHHEAAA